MKKQNVRTLSLIVCTFTYLLIGAAIFDALESENEAKNAEVLREMENMIIDRYGIIKDDYRVMEFMVLKGAPHYAGRQWKFAGAFYYATTVLTTIGYGHSTPHTIAGKLFTMAYALVGIPLGLVMFQSIGERLNNFSSFVIRNVKRMLKYDDIEASETNLILVVTALSTITISGGAAAFSKYEGWTYFDSIYYCFVTLTTIGFGDMVALQQDNALTDKPEYVAFVLVFILFGLAIVAACLNLFVLQLVTLNTEDERKDEAAAVKAAQGAVRLEGDIITANGSILSGKLPREQGGGSLINLDDSKSVCSCCCQCRGCLPWLDSIGGVATSATSTSKTRPGGGTDYAYVTSRTTPGFATFGRSYGALSSATFSVTSFNCYNDIYREHSVTNQAEYNDCRNADAEQHTHRSSGVLYTSSIDSPMRMYSSQKRSSSCQSPDRVLTVRRNSSGCDSGGGRARIRFSLRSLALRLRNLHRRFMNHRTGHHGRPVAIYNRSRAASSATRPNRTVVQQFNTNNVIESMDFVDIPLDDNTFLNWSASALSEKRVSL